MVVDGVAFSIFRTKRLAFVNILYSLVAYKLFLKSKKSLALVL